MHHIAARMADKDSIRGMASFVSYGCHVEGLGRGEAFLFGDVEGAVPFVLALGDGCESIPPAGSIPPKPKIPKSK